MSRCKPRSGLGARARLISTQAQRVLAMIHLQRHASEAALALLAHPLPSLGAQSQAYLGTASDRRLATASAASG